MAFLKFSRDKRGYENYYLFDGKGRPRLLFWFRTPPQVKVGRLPFSDDVRKMVEVQNPGVSFDWARIMATPIPSPDADHWRERRRAEKAAKRAARESVDVDVGAEAPPEVAPVASVAAADVEAQPAAVADTAEGADVAAGETEAPVAASDMQGNPVQGHRRRRRRRGRRGRHGPPEVPPANEV